MRVISGLNRGLKLLSPKDFKTRPTEDRVKENIFNLLGQNFYDAKVLDLFSGSGAIGIEFLSRGSKLCYFLDNSSDAIDIIKKNIDKSKNKEKSVVIKSDSITAIKNINNIKFDYIYIDPPYDNSDLYINSIKTILEFDILNQGGFIIVEESSDNRGEYLDYLNLIKERKYGNTFISVWSCK